MEMDDVESIHAARDMVHHNQMVGKSILAVAIEPQRLLACRPQRCCSAGVAAGEQRDLVPLMHELFCEIRHDPLSASVKLRRAAIVQGRNLRNSHCKKASQITIRL